MTYSEAYNKVRVESFQKLNLVFFLIKTSKSNHPEVWEVCTEVNMLHPLFSGKFAIFHSGKMVYSTWL